MLLLLVLLLLLARASSLLPGFSILPLEVPTPISRSARDRASSGALCRRNMLLLRHTVS